MQPRSSNRISARQLRRRLLWYGPIVAVSALTLAMLGLVMYGADRLVIRRQFVGAWASAEAEARRVEVRFFEDGSYRWTVAADAALAIVHRGHFRLSGTNRVSLVDDDAAGAEPFTARTTTYIVTVVADQLTLQSPAETLIFLRADG